MKITILSQKTLVLAKKIVLAIVAMPLPKMYKKKKIVLAIVAMPLLKMGKKKYEICERVKKKVVTSTIFLQYFHNKLHVINYY